MKHQMKNLFKEGPITPDFIASSIAKHSDKKNIGAHSIFLGQVRNDIIDQKEVIAIEYTAYEAMANEAFHVLRENIFQKYSLTCMHVYHSLGKVASGEISLFVFASSVHRTQAIEACQEIVELIKKEMPIWGMEIFEDESSIWKKSII
ncbi:MAG: molybdenum cofactor biosynthesis protein MoaE [Bacteroidetes bacterium]|nr:molybdenum cofactor biosynthesis protein MoaE [Bacteroidota bacterium]